MLSQLLDFLDRNEFNYLARKYGGDKYVKQFTCYNQLCVLIFGQLSNRESLRDVILATQATTFFHIIPARFHDTKAMDVIPYEENSSYTFDRGYSDFKRLHNIESIGAYIVIRGNTNNYFKPMKWKRRFPTESGIQSDAIGYMAGQLTMEKFCGTSENAVLIRIYSAIIAYFMMAIVQKKMNIERSIYEMLQIVSISLTERTPLNDLFAKRNYDIINELDGSTEPSLF